MIAADDRFAFIDVDSGESWVSGAQRFDQGAFLDEFGTCRVHEKRRGFHPGEIFPGNDAAGLTGEAHQQAQHVGTFEQFGFVGRYFVAGVAGSLSRSILAEHQNLHAESGTDACHEGADRAQSIDAEGASREPVRQRARPFPSFHAIYFLGNMAAGGENQCPGHFGRGNRRGMSAGGNDDPAFGARFDIDVSGTAAGLADEFKVGQALDEFARKAAALTDGHDSICGL
jgi:hypothetical protein